MSHRSPPPRRAIRQPDAAPGPAVERSASGSAAHAGIGSGCISFPISDSTGYRSRVVPYRRVPPLQNNGENETRPMLPGPENQNGLSLNT